jgi:hypothetical protein
MKAKDGEKFPDEELNIVEKMSPGPGWLTDLPLTVRSIRIPLCQAHL